MLSVYNVDEMKRIARTKISKQGHTTVPVAVKMFAGLESEDYIEWFIDEGEVVVRKMKEEVGA